MQPTIFHIILSFFFYLHIFFGLFSRSKSIAHKVNSDFILLYCLLISNSERSRIFSSLTRWDYTYMVGAVLPNNLFIRWNHLMSFNSQMSTKVLTANWLSVIMIFICLAFRWMPQLAHHKLFTPYHFHCAAANRANRKQCEHISMLIKLRLHLSFNSDGKISRKKRALNAQYSLLLSLWLIVFVRYHDFYFAYRITTMHIVVVCDSIRDLREYGFRNAIDANWKEGMWILQKHTEAGCFLTKSSYCYTISCSISKKILSICVHIQVYPTENANNKSDNALFFFSFIIWRIGFVCHKWSSFRLLFIVEKTKEKCSYIYIYFFFLLARGDFSCTIRWITTNAINIWHQIVFFYAHFLFLLHPPPPPPPPM